MSDWRGPAKPGMFEHEHLPERADDESFAGLTDGGVHCHSCAFGEGDPKWGKGHGDHDPISWGTLRQHFPHGTQCDNCYRPLVGERAHTAKECEYGEECSSFDAEEDASQYNDPHGVMEDMRNRGVAVDRKPAVPHLPENHRFDFGSQEDLDGERAAGEHWKRTYHQRKSDEGHAERMINDMFGDKPEAEFLKGNTQGPSHLSSKTAYGETKAPTQVDTLRDDRCPVCGEDDSYDGDTCQVCGYVAPPSMFRDPDLEKAKLLDLRQDPASGMPNDTNPNVGQNLPPVDPSQVTDEGAVEGEEAAEVQADGDNEDGVVEGDVRGLESGDGEEPVDPDEVDEDGEVIGGPEDPEAGDKHFQQGGEPFTPGPNAPNPGEPMDPEDLDDEGEAEDGQEIEAQEGIPGAPGTPGDGTPDLLCPACGFESDAAHPTSTPADLTAPANEGDGMLEGDICPQCQQATLMGVGEVAQMTQGQPA